MVSAELNYRNHIPYGYFAIKTSNLNFYGGDEDLTWSLDRLRSLVEFDKYDEHNIKIEKLHKQKQANYNEWLEWQKEIKTFKKEHLLWMLSRELREEMSILKAECDKLGANDEYLSFTISQLEDSKYYEASELTIKFKTLLAELGFTCKTATRNDSNLHEEIYESTCLDEELKIRVKNMIAELEKAKNEKQVELSDRYSQVDIINSEEIFYMN
jgi:hypothetical protein